LFGYNCDISNRRPLSLDQVFQQAQTSEDGQKRKHAVRRCGYAGAKVHSRLAEGAARANLTPCATKGGAATHVVVWCDLTETWLVDKSPKH
jgi:hypothetical protein